MPRRYTNLDGTTPDKTPRDLFRWMVLDRLAGRRPAHPPFETPRRFNDGRALRSMEPHATWIGHSTFVLRLGKTLIATDPIWSERAGGTVARNVPPGVAIEALPQIDVVTVSHNHYDHMDIPSLRRLGDALFIVPKDNAVLLHRAGIRRVVELEWWQTHEEGGVRVTLVPAQHWSIRYPWDRNQRLWGGFVIESSDGTAYHAGDTAFSEDVFRAIGERFPSIDWAMMPIGAYEPVWFMGSQHIGPEDAGRAWELLGAKSFVAMHWGTFKLTDEPLGEPPERIRAWWKERGHAHDRLWVMDIGETRALR